MHIRAGEMIPEVGGLGLGGPRGKGSPSVSKGPKPPIQLIEIAEKQSKTSKTGPFLLYIGPPGSHPGNGIDGARRPEGKVPPGPPGFSSHGAHILAFHLH